MFDAIWTILARWRTWIVNLALTVALVLPELFNAPEFVAIFPDDFQKWILVVGLLINIWMRPRPAVLKRDVKPKEPYRETENL